MLFDIERSNEVQGCWREEEAGIQGCFLDVIHFGGGLCTKSIPFSMLPFNPVLQASRSFFSSSLTCERMFVAFSAPED